MPAPAESSYAGDLLLLAAFDEQPDAVVGWVLGLPPNVFADVLHALSHLYKMWASASSGNRTAGRQRRQIQRGRLH